MEIVVSEHLLDSLPERLGAIAPRDTAIIADIHTCKAISDPVCAKIIAATKGDIILLRQPKASLELAEQLSTRLKDSTAAIAIGSGTINDLVKYASAKANIPYAVIATAPSMNGYTSATSSLEHRGFKQSFAAAAPIAVFADVDVLAQSPARMRAAGAGDMLCRATVQTDWRLSHALLDTPYDDEYFKDILPIEKEILRHAEGIAHGDKAIVGLLFGALLAGGDAMRKHGSSMPASQGEHMIAHTMEYLGASTQALHGEEIAVTALTMARLQKDSVAMESPVFTALKPEASLWKQLPAEVKKTFAKKAELTADAAQRFTKAKEWLRESSIDPATLETALKKAGCAMQARDIGWDEDRYKEACRIACYTRDRFTFLDLAAMNGLF